MTRDAASRRKCSDLCSRRGLRSRTSLVGGVDHPSGDRTGTLRPLGPRSVRLRARGNQPASLRPSIHSRLTPISADSQDCDGSIHCVLAGCSAAPSQHSFRPPHGNSSSLESDFSPGARIDPRRTYFYPRRATKGREELLFVRGGTRRGAENTRGVSGFLSMGFLCGKVCSDRAENRRKRRIRALRAGPAFVNQGANGCDW